MSAEIYDLSGSLPYHKNPRTISFKEFSDLGKWLTELGDISGIVHDLNSNEIIGGNQRTRFFKDHQAQAIICETFDPPTATGTVALGYVVANGERFAYRQVRWTPHQCERANVIANHAGGKFDWDILANQFDPADLLDCGFTELELGLKEIAEPEPKGDGQSGADDVLKTIMRAAMVGYEIGARGGSQTDLSAAIMVQFAQPKV